MKEVLDAGNCNECWKRLYPKLSPKEANAKLKGKPCSCFRPHLFNFEFVRDNV